jgi:hypothetical protein
VNADVQPLFAKILTKTPIMRLNSASLAVLATAFPLIVKGHDEPKATPYQLPGYDTSKTKSAPIPTSSIAHNHPSSETSPIELPVACGLYVPRAEVWQAYHQAGELEGFVRKNEQEFRENTTTQSFAIFLDDKYAPNASPSSLFCDAVGQCSIGGCLNLSPDFPTPEQQLAYLVFEQMAGIAHVMKVSARAIDRGGSYILHKIGWLVDNFSSPRRIEQALKTKVQARKIALAAGAAFGLLAGGAVGAPIPFLGQATPLGLNVGHVALDLIMNAYLGAVGIVNAMSSDVPDLDGNLRSWLMYTLNEVIHERAVNIDNDLRSLMLGEANHKNTTIFDILSSKDFLGPDPNLEPALTQIEERFLFAVSVNAAWRFDRPYLLDTNVDHGRCRFDDRGDPKYRVCLDEFPTKSFWLYNIGQGRENDFFLDDQAQVSGPSGLGHFESADQQTYNITREDVVRSSLWVHENGLSDAVEAIDVPEIGEAFKKEGVDLLDNDDVHWPNVANNSQNLGLVPGAFAVPVCRNPGGEAISSVNDDTGRNYPCMCGEFGWRHGWNQVEDQTPAFLVRSGFMFSEDWEDYCSDHNDCRGDNKIDLHVWLNDQRKDGDPKIPRKLKHPFKECKDPNSHYEKGHTGPEYGTPLHQPSLVI